MAARGSGAKLGGVLPNLRSFGPKSAIFRPKQPQKPGQNAQTKGNSDTFHVRLDFTVSESLLVPFNSTVCLRNGPKRRQKSPKTCAMRTNTPKPSTGRILGCVAQIRIPRAPSPPATPDFLWLSSLRIAQRATQTPVPVVIGGAGGQPGQRTVGATGGSIRVPGAKKIFFPKLFLDHLNAQTSVFSTF